MQTKVREAVLRKIGWLRPGLVQAEPGGAIIDQAKSRELAPCPLQPYRTSRKRRRQYPRKL